jgi:hypothetical protein
MGLTVNTNIPEPVRPVHAAHSFKTCHIHFSTLSPFLSRKSHH